jgi:hypothetical protein
MQLIGYPALLPKKLKTSLAFGENVMSSVASGSIKIEENKVDKRWLEAKGALRKFWIGGMAAACFSGIAHSIPIDLKAATRQLQLIDWHYTVDVFLSYLYMVWLMVYFFVTSFDTDQANRQADKGREPHTRGEITYDVLQSIAATIVVYRFTPSANGTTHHSPIDFAWANWAILFISFTALIFFREDTTENIQTLRGSAAILAVLSLVLIKGLPANLGLSISLLILLAGLTFLLGVYTYRRLREPSVGFSGIVAPPVTTPEPPPVMPIEKTAEASKPALAVEQIAQEGRTTLNDNCTPQQ